MRLRVSARDGAVVFVAVLMTAVYVYAVLLAASPERAPAPPLPDPFRLGKTIARVIVPSEPSRPAEPASEAAPSSLPPSSGDTVDQARPAASAAGEAATDRLQVSQRDVAGVRNDAAPTPRSAPNAPASPRGQGQAKGAKGEAKGAKGEAKDEAKREAKDEAKGHAKKASPSPATKRQNGKRTAKPLRQSAHPARGTVKHGGSRAHGKAPARARGHAKRAHRR